MFYLEAFKRFIELINPSVSHTDWYLRISFSQKQRALATVMLAAAVVCNPRTPSFLLLPFVQENNTTSATSSSL